MDFRDIWGTGSLCTKKSWLNFICGAYYGYFYCIYTEIVQYSVNLKLGN